MERTGSAPTGESKAAHRALLARARDGDARAFEAIVTARLPGAFRLARAILGSDVDAADAATNAIIAAWHELPGLQDLERFDDWLDRIVISECRMRLGGSASGASDGDMPAALVAQAMRAIEQRPQATRRVGARGGAAGPWRWPVILAAVIAVPVLVLVLAAAGAFRGFPGPGGDSPAASAPVAQASGTGTGAATGEPAASPPLATPPAESATPDLTIGSLAVVTLDGDNLRVRSLPGLGDASKKLKPTLPAGTRMLLVGGPVSADGYDWYEIQTDGELIDLFGWVASARGDEAWIAPAAPRCWGSLGAATIAGLDRIDFLACYGRTAVKVRARAAGLWDAHDRPGACGWVRDGGGCDIGNAWLLLPSAPVTLITDAGLERDLVLAMPPDLADALATLPRQSTLLLTVSMDAPEAAGCIARDADTGQTLIPVDRAITSCRLQFVVQEVAFQNPTAGPSPSADPAN